MNPAWITPHSLDSYWAEATAEIAASNRRAMIALRTADAIIKNIYVGNIGKLAAWLPASHVEKAPRRQAPTSTP